MFGIGVAMSAEIVSRCFGFLGDATSFVGALVLALKEAGEEERTTEVIATEETLEKYPELREILIDVDGVILQKPGDVELAVAKRASKRSRVGAWILAAGFVFLFIGRFIEAIYRCT
jgi:hypothetical protein